MRKIFAFITAVLAICSAVSAEAPGYKYLYTLTKDTDKIISASVLQDEAKFVLWEEGKLIYKDVFNEGDFWGKYMDFEPENFGIRMLQDDGNVRLIKPATVSAICYNPGTKIAALLMNLNYANSVISVCDMEKGRQIFTNLSKTHPPVPGRRFEAVVLEQIDLVPSLSEDASTVAYGVYTYMFEHHVEIVDIASGKISMIQKAAFPVIWKGRVYYLDTTDQAKKKFLIKTAALDGTKQEKMIKIDFEPSMLMLQRGVLYAVSGTKVYSLHIGMKKKFMETADFTDLYGADDSPTVVRLFPVVHDSKEFMIFVVKITKDDKTQLKFYSKQL
jgi:hypothetical protein